jgi:hypothetical protein
MVKAGGRSVDTSGMGIMERAREAAEQARVMVARPVEETADDDVASAAALAEDGVAGETEAPPARHRSPFSVFADKLDAGALADLVTKAGAMQEKVNATLRERGITYRISEVCFTATFPPQVSFYIATTPVTPGTAVEVAPPPA